MVDVYHAAQPKFVNLTAPFDALVPERSTGNVPLDDLEVIAEPIELAQMPSTARRSSSGKTW